MHQLLVVFLFVNQLHGKHIEDLVKCFTRDGPELLFFHVIRRTNEPMP